MKAGKSPRKVCYGVNASICGWELTEYHPLFGRGFIHDSAEKGLQIFTLGLTQPESSSTGYSHPLNRHTEQKRCDSWIQFYL